jgi:hypothetical protein
MPGRTLASDKTFGGMTLAQYEAAIEPSMTVRGQLAENDAEKTQLLATRADFDEVSLGKAAMVVAGVVGDPNFGPNSPLYEAMGYTRKSERKSGLHRKGGGGPPSEPKP